MWNSVHCQYKHRFSVASNAYKDLPSVFNTSINFKYSNVFFCSATAKLGSRPPHCWDVYITQLDRQTHTHTGLHSSERWSVSRGNRYLHSTQQTQETNIHALSVIRTRNPSNRAAVDPSKTFNQPKIPINHNSLNVEHPRWCVYQVYIIY
jgi:hypothetical protein